MTDLILANTKYSEDETVAILSGDSVDLIEAIAHVAQEVHVYDASYRTLTRLRRVVREKNVIFHDTVYPDAAMNFDIVHALVPKGREVARAMLWSGMNALKDDGEFYVTGANKGGAKTMIKDAEALFGNCVVLNYKKSHRIARSTKKQSSGYPSDWGKVSTELVQKQFMTPMGDVNINTMPGVFSWDELDEGTELLLDNLKLNSAKTILDMGCGVGIIGTTLCNQVEHVTLVDDNLLAIRVTTATINNLGIKNADVLPSDVYSAIDDKAFDLIACNPPFHKQFETNAHIPQRMIRDAHTHLNNGGRLVIVANAFLRYEEIMIETFGNCRTIASTSKFKVLEGKRG